MKGANSSWKSCFLCIFGKRYDFVGLCKMFNRIQTNCSDLLPTVNDNTLDMTGCNRECSTMVTCCGRSGAHNTKQPLSILLGSNSTNCSWLNETKQAKATTNYVILAAAFSRSNLKPESTNKKIGAKRAMQCLICQKNKYLHLRSCWDNYTMKSVAVERSEFTTKRGRSEQSEKAKFSRINLKKLRLSLLQKSSNCACIANKRFVCFHLHRTFIEWFKLLAPEQTDSKR